MKQMRRDYNEKIISFCTCYLFCFLLLAYAQDESSLKPYLNSEGSFKTRKADRIKADADRQMSVVKNLNSKMQSLQKETPIAPEK